MIFPEIKFELQLEFTVQYSFVSSSMKHEFYVKLFLFNSIVNITYSR